MQVSKICFKELQYLFYSPIGWLLLVIFFSQSAVAFFDVFELSYRDLLGGNSYDSYSERLFLDGRRPLFRSIVSNVYLYIPILTMAVFSRELQSGSIRLFLSSPVSAIELVLGKYAAIVVFAALLISAVFVFVLTASWYVPEFDWLGVVPGLFGIFLLVCCYGAIGVFISSVTQHQVIAAVVTLVVLFALTNVADWFSGIAGLNEIAFWLSLSGRAQVFQSGLIDTQHLFYFLSIIATFLVFTVLRLRNLRVQLKWPIVVAQAVLVSTVFLLAGWALSQAPLRGYFDLTSDKRNTLAPESQALLDRLEGPWTVETIANFYDFQNGTIGWPRNRIVDRQRYDQYRQHNPDISMEYVVYFDRFPDVTYRDRFRGMTKAQVAEAFGDQMGVDTSRFLPLSEVDRALLPVIEQEGYRAFRLIKWGDEVATLRFFNDLYRYPDERTRAAALKRLIEGPVLVGVTAWAGERSAHRRSAVDMQRLFTKGNDRFALVNHGFDFFELGVGSTIAQNIDILLIADPQEDYALDELEAIKEYIASGGNLILLVEENSSSTVDGILDELGLSRGAPVRQEHDEGYDETLILANITGDVLSDYWGERNFELPLGLPGAIELHRSTNSNGFEYQPIAYLDNRILGYALQRAKGGSQQRIIVLGDADVASTMNSDRSDPVTLTGIFDAFYWLSEGKYPVQLTRMNAIDGNFQVDRASIVRLCWVLLGVIPALIMVAATVILVRRRRR